MTFDPLDRIEAAAIEGRARTPRHIQKQLLALHSALTASLTLIHNAALKDTGQTVSETWFELKETLAAVRLQFFSIRLDDFVRQEYSIAHGQDHKTRCRPRGCVYIIPALHTKIYSTIQPLAVAISAGCCVVLELQPQRFEVDRVLAEVLQPAMDTETFAVVSERPTGQVLLSEHVIVAGDPNVIVGTLGATNLIKSPNSPAVAIVDRAANVTAAAQHIFRAIFSYRGRSPYAPNLVLVNEFVLEEFCQAAIKLLTEQISSFTNKMEKRSQFEFKLQDLEQAKGQVLISTSKGKVELLADRKETFVRKVLDAPSLLIHPITSLDDAIDTAQELASDATSLLALYVFARPEAAKYLSQFINSDICVVNHIPPSLLVGPAVPQHFTTSVTGRYTTEMFSSSSPEIIHQLPSASADAVYLDGTVSLEETQKLKTDLATPLPDIKEPDGKSVGFFEQGLFTGIAIELAVATGVFALCLKHALPLISTRWSGR